MTATPELDLSGGGDSGGSAGSARGDAAAAGSAGGDAAAAAAGPATPRAGLGDEGRRPRRRTALYAAGSVALVVAVLIGILARSPAATDVQARSPLLGKPAPAIQDQTLTGQAVKLGDFRGRFVLVNFFASWCVPCRQEQPELAAWYQEHQAAGDAALLGVVFSDSADTARAYEQATQGSWPVVGPDDQVALDYGVRGQPESYLIDPNGYVLTKIVGRVTAAGLDRLLAQAKAAGA